ncbi:MAG: hypothetical protein HC887_13190 [Desulfobacteraceae bacterium]|nr:hypothetical protein [Desulfobacteraceae bacterium]
MRCQIRIILILAIMIFPAITFSEPIPRELESWKPWVLHGSDVKLCPAAFNNGEAYFCSLPSRLTLAVEADGGTFGQQWLIFAEGWVSLPGSAELWPLQVTVNGKETPVIAQSGVPSIF